MLVFYRDLLIKIVWFHPLISKLFPFYNDLINYKKSALLSDLISALSIEWSLFHKAKHLQWFQYSPLSMQSVMLQALLSLTNSKKLPHLEVPTLFLNNYWQNVGIFVFLLALYFKSLNCTLKLQIRKIQIYIMEMR